MTHDKSIFHHSDPAYRRDAYFIGAPKRRSSLRPSRHRPLRICRAPENTSEVNFCTGFILGTRDVAALATSLRDAASICETPKEVKQDQLRAVVVKYLNDFCFEQSVSSGEVRRPMQREFSDSELTKFRVSYTSPG